MELKPGTRTMLCDEAYVFLCRAAVEQALAQQEKESASLAQQRPRFGILASRQKRDAFAQSVHDAQGTEAALRARLEALGRLHDGLNRALHRDLSEYLEAASPDYHLLARVRVLHDTWEELLGELPAPLRQFSRDLRTMKSEAVAPGRNADEMIRLAAQLRNCSVVVEEKQSQLDRVAGEVGQLAIRIGASEVRVPVIPAFRRSRWVEWLGAISRTQALDEITRAEFEVRSFLNGGLQVARTKLQTARTLCLLTKEALLDEYWDQLRLHTRQHHVRACNVDDVLQDLERRHPDAHSGVPAAARETAETSFALA